MTGSVEPYLGLVTDQHRDKPDFIATLTAILQPLADGIAVVGCMPKLFDLDVAVGAQLDAVGAWIGRSRQLSQALTGVYFTLGDESLGFGHGTWKGPFDPVTGLVALPDDTYRTLLRATIAANQWDGTIPDAYDVWGVIFDDPSTGILIQDNGDMSMLFAVTGQAPDAVTLGLLTGGHIALKPAGVHIEAYVTPTDPTAPYFGFGISNASIAGFGSGAWGEFTPPT